MAVLEDSEARVEEISELLEADAGLAVRLLRLANSPYFGLGREVANVNHGVMLLGFTVVRSLAVSSAAGMLVDGAPRPGLTEHWEHSATVAAGAAIVARFAGVSPGEAFSAGLLHDVGVVLLSERAGSDYDIPLACGEQESAAARAAERAYFGVDHASIGADVLEAWGLPRSLVEATRFHHETPDPSERALSNLVIVGESLSDAFARIRAAESDPEASDADQAETALAVAEEIVAPTLALAGIGRVHPTDLLQALRAEVARLDALVAIADERHPVRR
jgi:HD-like signal output (HDOD) protein